MYGAGMWIGGREITVQFSLLKTGPFTFVDKGTFEPITKTENFIGSVEYNPNEAEEDIIAKWKTSENISVTRTSRVWSFRIS